MPKYSAFLILTAISGLFGWMWPDVALVAGLTVILLPIGIWLAVAPALATILLLARLLQAVCFDWIRPLKSSAPFLGFMASLAALAIASALHSRTSDSQVAELVAMDHSSLTLPLPTSVIALQGLDQSAPCGRVCLFLLLSDQASEVMVLPSSLTSEEFDPGLVAKTWRIEERDICPNVEIPQNAENLSQSENGRPSGDLTNKMRQKIAQGHCLIQDEAPLDRAAAILSQQTNLKWLMPQNSINRGQITRLSVHLRQGEAFQEVYRKTTVHWDQLYPLWLPGIWLEGGFTTKRGLLSKRGEMRGKATASDPDDLGGFLLSTLDLKPLEEGETLSDTGVINARLDRGGALQSAEQELIAQYLSHFTIAGPAQDEDELLIQRLFQDERVELDYAAGAAIRALQNPSPEYLAKVTESLMLRLVRTLPDGNNQTEHIASVLASMPEQQLLPYETFLLELADNPGMRWRAWRLLQNLGYFGDAGAKKLLELAATPRSVQKSTWGKEWQHPHLAGMLGLCRMGLKASFIKGDFLSWVEEDRKALQHGSNLALGVQTMLSMGFSAAEIRKMAAGRERPVAPEEIEKLIKRYSERPACEF